MIPEQIKRPREFSFELQLMDAEAQKRARNNSSAKGTRLRTKQRHEDTAHKLMESEKTLALMQEQYKGTNDRHASQMDPCEMTGSAKLLIAMNKDLAAQLRQVKEENLFLLERNLKIERALYALSGHIHNRVDVYDESKFQIFADKVFDEDYEVKCFTDYPAKVLPRHVKVCENSALAMLNLV
jgi:hypothetical protein